MRRMCSELLATCPNLTIISGEVAEICTAPEVNGVVLGRWRRACDCRAVIVTTGTFLRGVDAHRRTEDAGRTRRRSGGDGIVGVSAEAGLGNGPAEDRHAAAAAEAIDRFFARSKPSRGMTSRRRFRI